MVIFHSYLKQPEGYHQKYGWHQHMLRLPMVITQMLGDCPTKCQPLVIKPAGISRGDRRGGVICEYDEDRMGSINLSISINQFYPHWINIYQYQNQYHKPMIKDYISPAYVSIYLDEFDRELMSSISSLECWNVGIQGIIPKWQSGLNRARKWQEPRINFRGPIRFGNPPCFRFLKHGVNWVNSLKHGSLP